jgi:cytidyltransferase-like protein
VVTVAVCGYFDPLHDGHRSHFKEAKGFGNKLVVIIHTDELCARKKGFCYQPLEERINEIKKESCVDEVVVAVDVDGTVAQTLLLVKPDILCKGGDRKPTDKPIPQSEIDACDKLGCTIIYGIGADKRPEWSSTRIARQALGLPIEG